MIYLERAAVLSRCGVYRYRLYRMWAEGPCILWVLLNPSTADASRDDRTVNRCARFAESWGFGSMWIGNVYAYRATKPQHLPAGLREAEGLDNAYHLRSMQLLSSRVVYGWGNHGPAHTPDLFGILGAKVEAWCLGKTMLGMPKHPLYIKSNTPLVRV
jgi:hypothetical protein